MMMAVSVLSKNEENITSARKGCNARGTGWAVGAAVEDGERMRRVVGLVAVVIMVMVVVLMLAAPHAFLVLVLVVIVVIVFVLVVVLGLLDILGILRLLGLLGPLVWRVVRVVRVVRRLNKALDKLAAVGDLLVDDVHLLGTSLDFDITVIGSSDKAAVEGRQGKDADLASLRAGGSVGADKVGLVDVELYALGCNGEDVDGRRPAVTVARWGRRGMGVLGVPPMPGLMLRLIVLGRLRVLVIGKRAHSVNGGVDGSGLGDQLEAAADVEQAGDVALGGKHRVAKYSIGQPELMGDDSQVVKADNIVGRGVHGNLKKRRLRDAQGRNLLAGRKDDVKGVRRVRVIAGLCMLVTALKHTNNHTHADRNKRVAVVIHEVDIRSELAISAPLRLDDKRSLRSARDNNASRNTDKLNIDALVADGNGGVGTLPHKTTRLVEEHGRVVLGRSKLCLRGRLLRRSQFGVRVLDT
jgi:hypothetical protein